MKIIIIFVLIIQIGYSIGNAYSNDASAPTIDSNDASAPTIDTHALKNKRLFFDAGQRGLGQDTKNSDQPSTSRGSKKYSKANAKVAPLISDSVVRYTGVVYSDRGVQILLNGYPWQRGQLKVMAARFQVQTQQIEIETESGMRYQLMPGDTVEIKP